MNTTLAALLGLGAVSLMGALTWATLTGNGALRRFLAAKASTNLWAREAVIVDDLAFAVVSDIEAGEKAALEKRAPGPLTEADLKQLKDLAMTRLKDMLKARGMDTLEQMLGAAAGAAHLDTYLSGKVEQAVAKVSTPTSPR